MISLAELLGIDESDPVYQAGLAKAKAQLLNAEVRYCANGCANYYEPGELVPFMGAGVAGCNEPECNGAVTGD